MTTKAAICLLVILAIGTFAEEPASQTEPAKKDDLKQKETNYGLGLLRPNPLPFVNRNPFLQPLTPNINPFLGLNSLRPINGSAVNAALPFYQNPYGYSALNTPFYNGVLPYANAPFLRSGIAPLSPVFDGTLPYAGVPLPAAPFVNSPYLNNGFGGFEAPYGLPYPVNPWSNLGYRGINPYGARFSHQLL